MNLTPLCYRVPTHVNSLTLNPAYARDWTIAIYEDGGTGDRYLIGLCLLSKTIDPDHPDMDAIENTIRTKGALLSTP